MRKLLKIDWFLIKTGAWFIAFYAWSWFLVNLENIYNRTGETAQTIWFTGASAGGTTQNNLNLFSPLEWPFLAIMFACLFMCIREGRHFIHELRSLSNSELSLLGEVKS